MSDTHPHTDGGLARPGPYRSLSAKRPRDPSHRKSVSFNDVPIVHEVPMYDSVRNSSHDIYRPWMYAETTPGMSIISPFASSSLHTASTVNYRVSSARAGPTLTNRIVDWTARGRGFRPTEDTVEHGTSNHGPLIVVHTPEERLQMHTTVAQPLMADSGEERRRPYRPATPHHREPSRSLPFSYVPLTESTMTYASMLSSNVAFHEQPPNGQSRPGRVPRPATASSRTVLKPATIAFQCGQPTLVASTSKSPSVPARLSSAAAHTRLLTTFNRPSSSAIKYTLPYPVSESASRVSYGTALTRSRSANILSHRRQTPSPVALLDGQSEGGSLYLSAKRAPHSRHAYGSYYTQRVLLPTDTN